MDNSTSLATIHSRPESWQNWALSTERTPLFTVEIPREDGEPELVTYTMPAKPNPGLALKFLKRARDNGELATVWLIEQAIGAEGYDALAEELINYEEQNPGQSTKLLQSIVERIQKVAMGGLESPKA